MLLIESRRSSKTMLTYMRRMIMELKMVVQDGEIDMIELQQVFECSTPFVFSGLGIMHLDGGDFDGNSCLSCPPKAKLWDGQRKEG